MKWTNLVFFPERQIYCTVLFLYIAALTQQYPLEIHNDLSVEFRVTRIVRAHDVDVCAGGILLTARSLSLQRTLVLMVGFCNTMSVPFIIQRTLKFSSLWRIYHHNYHHYNGTHMSRDSSVCIATDCTAPVRFPEGARFSLLRIVQTGSMAPPSLLSYGYRGGGGSFSGSKADHTPPSSTEVKKNGAIPPHLHTASWHNG
jgi:hypothetical protein